MRTENVALTATVILASITRLSRITAIHHNAFFSLATGFLVGIWLQLNLLQSCMFIPFVVTTNFLVNMSKYSTLTSVLFVIADVFDCAIIYAGIRLFTPNFKDIANQRTAIVIPLAAIIGSVIGGVVGGVFVVIQFGRSDTGQYDSEFVKRFISDCLQHSNGVSSYVEKCKEISDEGAYGGKPDSLCWDHGGGGEMGSNYV
ncbi:hypothetical protein BC829DRAFT_423604 [Chytridium lagenaria]|nr:hypothetical protein BC829DRAFT_423604 [Chytridium lagenaria]